MSTKIPEDLMCNVRVFKMEEIMQHLESALAPKVIFTNNLEDMRLQADSNRTEHIRFAMKLLYKNVAGLVVRPEMDGES